MKRLVLATLAAALAVPALAGAAAPVPENVLQLSASGVVEARQDLLSMTLSASRDAPEAATVQAQLQAVLEAALAEARRSAQPGQMDVRTGAFSIVPRYTQGRMAGWQGQAQLVLEGRDFGRIAQAAGRIPGMTVQGVAMGLSREQRARVEGEAQQQAVERFKARATELAKGFGFGGYTLREVSVNTNEPGGFMPQPRLMAAAAAEGGGAPIPVEAGRAAVTVTVSGSVQLR
ncbi:MULTISPECIES: SIMPL domain-containing protein [Ramlibacter]|uniref:SIMPL domain-containing protein n=1 Tax=Ramlibacter aquaticus TaxID=2780094 RepID=A0ABR9SDP5_9BURK|nr:MULTISPECIES: SIMPL domain-containing protein [Ramlibacter]MBE7940479.1 SIMPL domain-containing protein [Ramlibacter aquaticus]